jgi:glutathione-independent formaldehyde dehydrogenase
MPYLSEVVNTEVIPLEKALEAYRAFDDGAPKKFVLDPHGSVRG